VKVSDAAGGAAESDQAAEIKVTSSETASMLDAHLTAAQISAVAERLRSAARAAVPPECVAIALGVACERWRDRNYVRRRETVGAIAAAWGWSEVMIDESIDALMAPMSRSALENQIGRLPCRSQLVGLIMPGNVPGAGIHEIAVALLAGCAIIVKTAAAEPFFFSRFAQTLREADAAAGDRLTVLNWSRARSDLTASLRRNCDWIAAFGSDDTIGALDFSVATAPGGAGRLAAAFGSRVSGALVAAEFALQPASTAIADALARDMSLFEQQGCLSPHHVFVESADSRVAARFASELSAALERFAVRVPPPRRHSLEDAAAVRRVRETARWRALGGSAVVLAEGDNLGWTLVYDHQASFNVSPGYRTVTVSGIADLTDLKRRLQPVTGRIEAFAIAASRERFESLSSILATLGVSYVCEPGAMQSPPLDWSHGGGVFRRALANSL
jgi:hypothetical protein